MEKINYKKILKHLLKEKKHDIDKIENLVETSKRNGESITISIREIITDNEWSIEEKVRLLKLFNLDIDIVAFKDDWIKNKGYCYYACYALSIIYSYYLTAIENRSLSGVIALTQASKDLWPYLIDYADQSYSSESIFKIIFCKLKNDQDALTEYTNAILNNLDIEERKSCFKTRHYGFYLDGEFEENLLAAIIKFNNLKLVEDCIDYIDDINHYLPEAVATGNVEMVKFFLDKGADINYVENSKIVGKVTPLKMAIAKNDYEMVKFLVENGANASKHFSNLAFSRRIKNYKKPHNYFSEYEINEAKHIETSTALEYASKAEKSSYINGENLRFLGSGRSFKNCCNYSDDSKELENRKKIIYYLESEAKSHFRTKINYEDLLYFATVIKDGEAFKRYAKIIIEKKIEVDTEFLMRLFFASKVGMSKNLLNSFVEFIHLYENDFNLSMRLFEIFEDSFYNSGFKKENIDIFDSIIEKVPVDKRKDLDLILYCKDVESVKHLVNCGFDLNHRDKDKNKGILDYYMENGWNISNDDEMLNYLMKNLKMPKKEKSLLCNALFYTKTKDEEYFSVINGNCGDLPISEQENNLITLVKNTSREEVQDPTVSEIFDSRLNRYDGSFYPELIYQVHKELMTSLVNKGFILSRRAFERIFSRLYRMKKGKYQEQIDFDESFAFLFEVCDSNTEIQKVDLEEKFNKIHQAIAERNFERFIESLKEYNEQINNVIDFKENVIPKKVCPDLYMDYAKEKYNIDYLAINKNSIIPIVISAIAAFGDDKLDIVLEAIPDFNVNEVVENADIGLNINTDVTEIKQFDEKSKLTEDGNLKFTGGLLQYAVLVDNIDMVKLLHERGANLSCFINNKEVTSSYVNSEDMKNYLEMLIGKDYNDFDLNVAEYEYYMRLIGKTSQNDSEIPEDSTEKEHKKILETEEISKN